MIATTGNDPWTGLNEPDAWIWSDGTQASQARAARPAECTLDLSAIPTPARPALAEALQAAVARLAEGWTGLDPTRAGDALLRELIWRQMAGMLREAVAEPCSRCGGEKWIPSGGYAYRCERCGGTGREPQAAGGEAW